MSRIPIVNDSDELIREISKHEFSGKSTRPYDGQPHTFSGERGRQTLPPITLRDLADVVVKMLDEANHPGFEWQKWGPTSMAQNICVALEETYPEHFKWFEEHFPEARRRTD